MGRAAVFFFLSSLLLLFFYLLGNYQDFLDSTQFFILSILQGALILQLVCGFSLVVIIIARTITERRVFSLRFVFLLLSMAVSGALLFALRFLQSWLQS
jgi:Ca2+/Na+ antiporter